MKLRKNRSFGNIGQINVRRSDKVKTLLSYQLFKRPKFVYTSTRFFKLSRLEENLINLPELQNRFSLSGRSDTQDSHHKAVNRVINVMCADPNRTMTIDDMAQIAYISPYHFIRVFHAVTGVAPCKFLWALKLHTAKQLLLATRMAIVDISMEVGYNSLGTFTRRFAELVGLPPNRFRHLAMAVNARTFEGPLHDPRPLPSMAGAIQGEVHVPADFKGAVLVACFSSPLSQGRPLQYAWCDSLHQFSVLRPKSSNFYMRAFGLPHASGTRPWLTDEHVLRSRGIMPPETRGFADDRQRVNLALRSREPIDPPILLSLGTLVFNFVWSPAARSFGCPEGRPQPYTQRIAMQHEMYEA